MSGEAPSDRSSEAGLARSPPKGVGPCGPFCAQSHGDWSEDKEPAGSAPGREGRLSGGAAGRRGGRGGSLGSRPALHAHSILCWRPMRAPSATSLESPRTLSPLENRLDLSVPPPAPSSDADAPHVRCGHLAGRGSPGGAPGGCGGDDAGGNWPRSVPPPRGELPVQLEDRPCALGGLDLEPRVRRGGPGFLLEELGAGRWVPTGRKGRLNYMRTESVPEEFIISARRPDRFRGQADSRIPSRGRREPAHGGAADPRSCLLTRTGHPSPETQCPSLETGRLPARQPPPTPRPATSPTKRPGAPPRRPGAPPQRPGAPRPDQVPPAETERPPTQDPAPLPGDLATPPRPSLSLGMAGIAEFLPASSPLGLPVCVPSLALLPQLACVGTVALLP
uniref:Uncharacterized protein n=1 Tax=Rangifer tarandus platyrhynchus TaxID=3082113 RepID=A0ACB0FN12_RANTA|nr:unnamed protein product [Rangifer tarandus platyrhynchus]